MSWLISLVIAGVMFASDGNSPVRLNYIDTNDDIKSVVKLDETERFEQTYSLNPNGRVGVSNINGSITIDTWDNPQVKLEYVKTADNRERLSEVEVKIDARQDSVKVETDYDKVQRGSDRNWKNDGKLVVEYHLTVPRNAVLDQIETVNGGISISNAANMTKASAVNGEVRATNLRGTANLSTVNGTVEADFDRLQTGSRISLDTVNGTVNLVIPSDASATVKADTVNGSIVNDFGLPVRKGQFVGKNLYGRIGSGDVQIRLNSVNGGLSIKRKNDGRNVGPATNLLPQKNNGDDSDNDGALSVNAAKINKDAAKALADAQKEAAGAMSDPKVVEAMNEARGKIANLDIGKITIDALHQANLANYFVGAPVIEKKNDSFAVRGVPNVTIEARGGSVAVRGWDKPEVSYSVVKIGENRSQTPLDIKASQNASDVNIKIINIDNAAQRGNFFDNSSRVRIEIFVPKKSNLKIAGDGEIRLENVSGDIDLQGVDETVNVRDAGGKLSVGTNDGTIRVIGFRGAFTGKTADGTMNLEGDFQSFNAFASDGTIILTLPENADAVLEANTEIENDGLNLTRKNAGEKLWRVGNGGTTYQMSVEDGKIIVRNANIMKMNGN